MLLGLAFALMANGHPMKNVPMDLDTLRVPLVKSRLVSTEHFHNGVEAVDVPAFPNADSPSGEADGTSTQGLPTLDAPWIWLSPYSSQHPVAARFRTVCNLGSAPKKATVDITAEARYQLFINGQLVSRGPADIGRDYDSGPVGPWLFDRRDVGAYFREGRNAIAVIVYSDPLVSSEAVTGRPGLCFKAKISTRDGVLELQSGPSWKAIPDPSTSKPKVPSGEPLAGNSILTFDANQEDPEWVMPNYDDKTWPAAEVVTHEIKGTEDRKDTRHFSPTRSNLQVSQLPPLMEQPYPVHSIERVHGGVRVAGHSIDVTGEGGLAVRFERILSGYAGLKVRGTRGTVITVMPSELPQPGSSRPFRWVLRDGEQIIQSPMLDSFSTLNIEFSNVTGPVKVEEVRALFSSYPVKYRGSFECSDPQLTDLWHTGRWLTQICMQTHHLDSPNHQEPICDPGDYLIESLINYQTFGESALAAQDIYKYSQLLHARSNKVFHTSYALLWMQMRLELLRYWGYKSRSLPTGSVASDLLETWNSYVGKNGLISEAPNYMFMDWIQLEGFELHHPPAVIGQGYMTALYYKALSETFNDHLSLAREPDSGKPEETKKLARINALKEAFDRELWSASEGLYRDGKPFQTSVRPSQWLPADKNIETFSTQVNTLAVACGLTDRVRSERIMRKLMAREDLKCQPYFMHFVFEALDKAGVYNEFATQQMRRWKIIPETQSFREMWHDGDYSHAWGASPTYQLSSRVLGIQPDGDGFPAGMVLIEPHPCDLTWAKGSVPTPLGDVRAEWKVVGSLLTVTASLPKGVKGRVKMPDGQEKKFTGQITVTSRMPQS